MAKAGHCAVCGTTVYLTETGACSNGHGPENISGVYDTDPGTAPATPTTVAEAPAPAEAPKKKNGLIIIIVLVALLLCCCIGTIAAVVAAPMIGLPVFGAAQADAEKRTCFANQRTLEGAVQVYAADNEDGEYPYSLDDLVPDYIQEMPECPTYGDGAYELDTDTGSLNVYCEHGHF